MEIRRDTVGYNSLTAPKPANPSRGVYEIAPAQVLPQREFERRNRPDRRRQQQPFAGADRRHKTDRRRPELLNGRRLEPDRLGDRRGRLIDIRV